jgi:3'-phosphoadenosine 5'-phosphosulfate (PAPS) 3'-phosphatase
MSRRRALLAVLATLCLATALLHLYLARSAALPRAHSVSAHTLFEALLRATVAGGDAVAAARGGGGGATMTRYADGTAELHTGADAASSAAISAALAASFPALNVIDEERVAGGGGWRPTRRSAASLAGGDGGAPLPRHPLLPFPELAVWVDPLDATQEFSERKTEFVTVSACLTRCGVPIAGAVYAPFSGRLYWSRPGSGVQVAFSVGAALDAERALPHGWGAAGGGGGGCCVPRAGGVAPSRAFPPAAAAENATRALSAPGGGGLRVVVSRSHGGGGGGAARALAAAAAAAGAPAPALRPVGGAGYKMLRLLEGDADAYLHGGSLRKWDTCAGDALLREAGGGVADASGGALDYCLPRLAAAGEAAHAAAVAAAVAVRGVVAAADTAVGAQVVRALENTPGEH